MNNNKQFEIYFDEFINAIVTVKINNDKINILNITIENDAPILLSDLSKENQEYVLEEANKYLLKLKE